MNGYLTFWRFERVLKGFGREVFFADVAAIGDGPQDFIGNPARYPAPCLPDFATHVAGGPHACAASGICGIVHDSDSTKARRFHDPQVILKPLSPVASNSIDSPRSTRRVTSSSASAPSRPIGSMTARKFGRGIGQGSARRRQSEQRAAPVNARYWL